VTRVVAVAAIMMWIGSALVLSELRWFNRGSLVERLRPFAPGGLRSGSRGGLFSVASFHELIAPLAQSIGGRLSRIFGVSEELEIRLRRCHSPLTVSAFRTRQLGWSLAAFGACALVSFTFRLPALFILLFIVGAPLLAFLVCEQQVQSASKRWQRRIFLELPVITEQLGMLLSSGFSLGAALNRIAERSHGAIAQDLAIVCGRIRQGLSEITALREWADLVDVDALGRLVGILALNREAGDLGRLITEEARSVRAEAHRELIEQIERRAQQVWIPVTVATLVPGVIFMAVPFIEALRLFTQ
jgi:tight adherence protein C